MSVLSTRPRSVRLRTSVRETVPHAHSGSQFEEARIHRSRDLREEDTVMLGPFRVTTVERTMLDCASMLRTSPSWLSAMIYSAARKNSALVTSLDRVLTEQGTGKRGAAKLRTMLRERSGEKVLPQSPAESFLRDLMRTLHVQPALQYSLSRRQHVDFAWPEHQLIVEVDSRFHDPWHPQHSDDARDQSATRAGWATLRYTWREIRREKARVLDEIKQMLQRRAPSQSLASGA